MRLCGITQWSEARRRMINTRDIDHLIDEGDKEPDTAAHSSIRPKL